MMKVSDEETSLDIRNSIQAGKEKKTPNPQLHWHPSSLMNHQNLELCTECLGSETGSDGFFSAEEFYPFFSSFYSGKDYFEAKTQEKKQKRRKELTTVNHHYSIGQDSPRPRSFPPVLSSVFIQMRPFRRDGHFILKAVSLPSHNYLHSERHSGRLVLSFISKLVEEDDDGADDEKEEGEEEEEEEEEEEVLDRGTVVDVKVSAKPQLVCGIAATKVLWPTLVINKFVIGIPLADADESTVAVGAQRISLTTGADVTEVKPLFWSKRRSREELLREIRQCGELRRRFCIALPPPPELLLNLRF